MKKLNLTYKNIVLYVVSFVIIVGGDQITKIIVDHTLSLGASYSIIDRFFYFTYSHNDGAAWGILSGKLNLFFVIAIIATIGIIYYFVQSQPYQKLTRFGLVLIFSGMIGNLIDRIYFGYVRDFIDFIIFGYDFPIFNVADMAITIGFVLVIIEVGIEEYKAWKISKSEL
ncbi:signal peptidase II [Candidatus Stoquefichus massiliensis]|uniref:signal peptidase II n=1 Tax=Candidatus Stoquefichus massiliensis TaxID=1470350 RepID=UPI000484A955|nr:signal peptidase II [Candidatus Stoquefichus massiliensis]